MLGQREKIIVIHLKSVLDFEFQVIQGHSRSFMTRLRSNRLGIRLWWRCNQICVETYVITNGVNDTTNNQTKTDEKTAFWYSWVHWKAFHESDEWLIIYDSLNMTHLDLHNENQFWQYQQKEPTYIPPKESSHLPNLMLLWINVISPY